MPNQAATMVMRKGKLVAVKEIAMVSVTKKTDHDIYVAPLASVE